ncbi:MAG: N-acetylmuramoyl-L-alanine amidase [Chloroflexota bacterium]
MLAALLAVVAAAAAVLFLLRGPAARCPLPSADVVLDPGHGGSEPGAVNAAAGVIERDLNLDTSNRVAGILRGRGLAVALTREDNATHMSTWQRGRIANACEARVFVSIHHNSVSDPVPNHVLTLYADASDIPFAQAMQDAMVRSLAEGPIYDGGLRQLRNGGMIAARMPAALVEPVFLSNPEEAARLAAPDGARRQQIAEAIADGVIGWLEANGGLATPAPFAPAKPTPTPAG